MAPTNKGDMYPVRPRGITENCIFEFYAVALQFPLYTLSFLLNITTHKPSSTLNLTKFYIFEAAKQPKIEQIRATPNYISQ